MFTIEEILSATGGRLLKGSRGAGPVTISTDSRTVNKGEVFLALKGEKFDGHDFIDKAVRRGADGVLSARRGSIAKRPRILVRVNDTRAALAAMACHHRNKFTIPLIGVTGSNGKTTVKEMAWRILADRHQDSEKSKKVLKNEGNENNLIGVTGTLLKLKGSHRMGVLEMGMNHVGEIRFLSRIVRPSIGVITNIGPSHLEFLGNLKNVLKAKAELLEALSDEDVIILNGDDKLLLMLKKKTRTKALTFGLSEGCDFRATNISSKKGMYKFWLNDKYPFSLKACGQHNIHNALAAIAVSSAMGVNWKVAKKALSEFEGVEGRCRVRRIRKITFIDDTYNSNPLSSRCAYGVLRDYPVPGKRILVGGDMLELGDKSPDLHYEAGQRAVKEGAIDLLITVGSLTAHMRKGAISAGLKRKQVICAGSHDDAAKLLSKKTKLGDVVLVKGSRGMEMEKIFRIFSKI